MIIKFELFENLESRFTNGEYYYIPYNDEKLIKLLCEKERDKLKLTNEKIDELKINLSKKNWYLFKGLYIILSKSEYLGYWLVLANEIEEEKEKIDRNVFFERHEMTNKGVLELPRHIVSANKYNL